jgi:uncharacterized metal-binding protein
MPDGRTHDNITMVTASFMIPISAGLIFEEQPGRAVLFLGSYLLSGLMFSDDLDIHSIEYRRWRILRFLWMPYQKLVPHRSWLSHGLIIGPLLRVMYFAAICTAAIWLALTALSRVLPLDATGMIGGVMSALAQSVVDHPEWWAVAFIGFVLGGAAHSVSDGLWSWWRHAWRAPVISVQVQTADQPTHHGEPMPDYMR